MKLCIYGAGGLGREVYELASTINHEKSTWEQILFIDDGFSPQNPRGLEIFSFENFAKCAEVNESEFVVAVGEPRLRGKLFAKMKRRGFQAANLIHPSCEIPTNTKLGSGVVVCKFVSITCDISIGDNVYIHPTVCVGHDSVVKENSVISSFVDIAGDCEIGSEVYVGLGALIKEGVSIGDKTIIGMGSVVYDDIPGGLIALGNPARPMRRNVEQRVFREKRDD